MHSEQSIDRGYQHGHPHHHHHKIPFTVDGEPVEVLSASHEGTELTVREVLDVSGNKPASDFYLVELHGEGNKHRREFKDLNETIKVKKHARFAAVCLKPTPVS